jgi:valyl-tRNA synthetase
MDYVLSAVLRLLHPFMPHLTEELWSIFGFGEGSIQFAPLPTTMALPDGVDSKRSLVAAVYEIVQSGRNLRAQAGIAVNQKAKFALRPNNSQLVSEESTLSRLLNVSELVIDSNFKGPSGVPVAMTRAAEVFLLVEVDRAAERGRLDKEIAKLETDLNAAEAKLSNKSFVDRAPANVVEEHRDRVKKFTEQLAKLRRARDQL